MNELKKLTEDMEKSNQNAHRLNNINVGLTKEKRELELKLKQTEDLLSEKKNELAESVKALTDSVEKVASLTMDLTKLQTEHHTLETDFESLEKRKNAQQQEHQKEIALLKVQVDGTQSKITRLKDAV